MNEKNYRVSLYSHVDDRLAAVVDRVELGLKVYTADSLFIRIILCAEHTLQNDVGLTVELLTNIGFR